MGHYSRTCRHRSILAAKTASSTRDGGYGEDQSLGVEVASARRSSHPSVAPFERVADDLDSAILKASRVEAPDRGGRPRSEISVLLRSPGLFAKPSPGP